MQTEATSIPAYSFWTMFLSGVALSLWSAVPWTVLFLFIRWTGLRLYVLNDRDICRRIQRRVTNTSHMSDDNKSYGYAVGRWYLMDISVENNDGDVTYCIWMIATVASHKRLTADLREATEDEDEKGATKKTLAVFERAGSYHNLWYRERKVGVALNRGTNRPPFFLLLRSWLRSGIAVMPLSFCMVRLALANP
jgi:hypothetical protein